MGKSIVAVFCGGRGSGKTLSMTAEGCLAMIVGKNVWSNYPIHVTFRYANGEVKTYHSTIIDMPDIIEMQSRDEIRDGLVLLDEWSLFCNSRRSGSTSTMIFGGIVQLIRKRKLSFYITTQDFGTLDKNIRWQCDLTVQCFDLNFRYPNLKEGQVISQYVTDWSGVYTGRPVIDNKDWEVRDRNSRTRLLMKAQLFWGCYPTGFEYDILEVMSTRYNLTKKDKTIDRVGDNGGFDISMLTEYRDSIIEQGIKRVDASDLQSALKDMGLDGDLRGYLGQKVKAAGFQYKGNPKGNYYEITED